jgi:hypothetical protein
MRTHRLTAMTLGWLAALVFAAPAFGATVDYDHLYQSNIPPTFRNGTDYFNLESATGTDVAAARIGAYHAASGGALITQPAHWTSHAPGNFGVKRFGFNRHLSLLSGDFGDALSRPVRNGGGIDARGPLLFAIDTGSAPGYFFPSVGDLGEGHSAFVAHVIPIDNPGTCRDSIASWNCHAVVPLPASVWLLLSGFVALGALARRRGQI